MQVITKLERLPNELFLECFDYLNGFDIFYSFYQLNYRFDKLIQSIPLQINCEHIPKTIFDRFSRKLLKNPEVKQQIHSLRLFNDDASNQIEIFFSFDKLHSLRSLTLVGINKNDIEKLKTNLSLISELDYLHLINPNDEIKGELSLKRSPSLVCHLPLIFQISSITNLTLTCCSCHDLSHLFKYAPMLKYLNVQNISKKYSWTKYYNGFNKHIIIHLKQLIMKNFQEEFEKLTMLIEQTPALESLTIESDNKREIIDAPRWEYLITSLLPQLTIFKFKFDYDCSNDEHYIFDKCKEFQNDFWQEQHQWCTEYSYYPSRATIYTIPHMSNYKNSLNKINSFNNPTELIMFHMDV